MSCHLRNVLNSDPDNRRLYGKDAVQSESLKLYKRFDLSLKTQFLRIPLTVLVTVLVVKYSVKWQ